MGKKYLSTIMMPDRRMCAMNTKGYEHALKCIGAGRIETKDPYDWTEKDRQELLGENGDDWNGYACAHLGEDTNRPEETRARYTHPMMSKGMCSKAALINIGTSDNDDEAPVARAARRLLRHVGMSEDEGKAAGFDVYRKGVEVCEETSAHAEALILAGSFTTAEMGLTAAPAQAKTATEWKEYGQHFLGEDNRVYGSSRERWSYQVVQNGVVSREALVQTAVKAAETGDADVAAEARRLVKLIDACANARRGIDPELKSVGVNSAARAHANALISSGKVDKTSSWSFSAEDGNAMLGNSGDSWAEYGKWHLGIDAGGGSDTKARYKYPIGKNGKLYRSAVIAAKQRAAATGASSVEAAAAALLERIDKGKE